MPKGQYVRSPQRQAQDRHAAEVARQHIKHGTDCKCASCRGKRGEYSGIGNPRYGAHLSEETKRKISDSEKGKRVIVTDKHRENMSKAMKGKYVGSNHWSWKGGRRNSRLNSPLLYAIRNCGKYKQWKGEILDEAFPNGKPNGFEVHVHHIVKLSVLLRQYNVTTLEQALECAPLWDKKNVVVITKSEHYIMSVLERRLKPSKGLITVLKNWLNEGKFKVYPIGEMIGSPYEDKVRYKELVPTQANQLGILSSREEMVGGK